MTDRPDRADRTARRAARSERAARPDPTEPLSRRRLVALLGAFGVAPEAVRAQDPAKTDARNYRVVLENAKVRVLDYTGRPSAGVCGVGKHSHPAHVTVQMTPVTVRVTAEDGRQQLLEVPAGAVFYEPAIVHTTENLGSTVSRAFVIEIKDAQWHPASGTD